MGECFNCGEPASRSYTLVFESGVRLEDRLLCADCYAFFDESAHIEVVEAPVLVRGGQGPLEETEE